MQLWHDGSGLCANWFVSKVTVEAVPYSSKYEATFNAWVKGGEDRQQTRPFRLIGGARQTGCCVAATALRTVVARQTHRVAASPVVVAGVPPSQTPAGQQAAAALAAAALAAAASPSPPPQLLPPQQAAARDIGGPDATPYLSDQQQRQGAPQQRPQPGDPG